ncbi:hypothetical protein B0J18DRAFT_465501 [Chaetomium sp. MPI-SDFR-AT-0129]|nr:hypothetical protein B0J18DRAFT_465501 [Chaetomium sp. MPI-SDFR-AT-0129]
MTTTATVTTNPNLLHFTEAMRLVYGNTDQLPADTVSTWTAPSQPGAGGHRGRYLWTDAFGVVNFISLARETGSTSYLTIAQRLAKTVHDVLGRTRDGKARLPRATDEEPLAGGLRIGKMEEKGPDGDGQYHHYLTLWMFALDRLARATGEGEYNRLAVQLAKAIHPHFVLRRRRGSEPDVGGSASVETLRMVWKISTDMNTVLVPSEGHLDAATGYVVYSLLRQTAKDIHSDSPSSKAGDLSSEIEDYRRLMNRTGKLSASRDPLDLGMGLWMCHFFKGKEDWADVLGGQSLEMAEMILDEERGLMARDASRRLAFREFGTCLGLRCFGAEAGMEKKVQSVVDFWHHYLEKSTDEDLRPISLVMYAAALVPGAWKGNYLSEKQ